VVVVVSPALLTEPIAIAPLALGGKLLVTCVGKGPPGFGTLIVADAQLLLDLQQHTAAHTR
jgi:hypothetical protein